MCTKKRATDSVSFAAENHNRYTIEAVYLYVFNFHSPWNKHFFMDSVTHCMKFPSYCTISTNLTKPQTHKLWWCLVSGLHSVVETGQRLITPLRKGVGVNCPQAKGIFYLMTTGTGNGGEWLPHGASLQGHQSSTEASTPVCKREGSWILLITDSNP